ncbi:hypothetical protein ES288_D13G220800v1 [Gossypium darwinii]|uniref:Prokaryotic-type class I peptide chain release factors domain-containing protein n=1 Tax=Gossypium darwinii TaxID=34276 RepID=A0A5D2A0M9_GOSDA|nr:hypothetical protein ES288_D13G220800v1 [Gossypium darwinii]
MQQLIQEAEERASSARNEPTPQITLDHVTVSFARSGSPGGQNVNKVNTKVDKRFNVKQAYWLSDWIRERIMQMVRKEKLGDRITALHQLVSPFGKSRWTFSKIQKSLFLHGSCFEEFIELHFHATDMFHTQWQHLKAESANMLKTIEDLEVSRKY